MTFKKQTLTSLTQNEIDRVKTQNQRSAAVAAEAVAAVKVEDTQTKEEEEKLPAIGRQPQSTTVQNKIQFHTLTPAPPAPFQTSTSTPSAAALSHLHTKTISFSKPNQTTRQKAHQQSLMRSTSGLKQAMSTLQSKMSVNYCKFRFSADTPLTFKNKKAKNRALFLTTSSATSVSNTSPSNAFQQPSVHHKQQASEVMRSCDGLQTSRFTVEKLRQDQSIEEFRHAQLQEDQVLIELVSDFAPQRQVQQYNRVATRDWTETVENLEALQKFKILKNSPDYMSDQMHLAHFVRNKRLKEKRHVPVRPVRGCVEER